MATVTWTISGNKRLESRTTLTPEDFHDIARTLGVEPVRARKIGCVRARQVEQDQRLETRWNGKETVNTARPGDWLVTGLSSRGDVLRDREGHENRYVVRATRFPDLYEGAEGCAPSERASSRGAIYRAKGVVLALPLPGGFDILAPWGERQTAPDGYLILNGEEVYGNNAETFRETYEEVEGSAPDLPKN